MITVVVEEKHAVITGIKKQLFSSPKKLTQLIGKTATIEFNADVQGIPKGTFTVSTVTGARFDPLKMDISIHTDIGIIISYEMKSGNITVDYQGSKINLNSLEDQ